MAARPIGGGKWPSFTRDELERAPGYKLEAGGARSRSACPIHGGDNPTAFVFDFATGWGHCHTRKCHGYLDDGTRRSSQSKRPAPYGSAPQVMPAQPKERAVDPDRVRALQKLWPRMVRAFPGSPAETYLADRGIPMAIARAARVGYDRDGDLWYDTAPADTPPAERKRYTRGRVVFPLATSEGQPINAAARRLTLPGNEPKDGRWLYLKGSRGYFNAAGLRQAGDERRTLFLCEGVVDALALMAGGITTAVAMGGVDGVVKREHLRGLYRMVLCLDADNAGQSSGPEIGRLARTVGCAVAHLTSDHLARAGDVAEYWQTHGTLPAFLRELAAEEETTLDADLIAEYAARYSPDYIAERLADQWARWDDGERTPALRRTIADWQAIAARRAQIDAERAREHLNADTGPDDGDTGEALAGEG